MRMMMAHMRLHENPNTSIWPECATTTTKPENIMVNPHEEKCAHKKFYGKIPDYTKSLKTLGGMRVIHSITTVNNSRKIEE